MNRMLPAQITSAIVHPHCLYLEQSEGLLSAGSILGERLPEEDVRVVETADSSHQQDAPVLPGAQRRKLYFNPAYFDRQLLLVSRLTLRIRDEGDRLCPFARVIRLAFPKCGVLYRALSTRNPFDPQTLFPPRSFERRQDNLKTAPASFSGSTSGCHRVPAQDPRSHLHRQTQDGREEIRAYPHW